MPTLTVIDEEVKVMPDILTVLSFTGGVVPVPVLELDLPHPYKRIMVHVNKTIALFFMFLGLIVYTSYLVKSCFGSSISNKYFLTFKATYFYQMRINI